MAVAEFGESHIPHQEDQANETVAVQNMARPCHSYLGASIGTQKGPLCRLRRCGRGMQPHTARQGATDKQRTRHLRGQEAPPTHHQATRGWCPRPRATCQKDQGPERPGPRTASSALRKRGRRRQVGRNRLVEATTPRCPNSFSMYSASARRARRHACTPRGARAT